MLPPLPHCQVSRPLSVRWLLPPPCRVAPWLSLVCGARLACRIIPIDQLYVVLVHRLAPRYCGSVDYTCRPTPCGLWPADWPHTTHSGPWGQKVEHYCYMVVLLYYSLTVLQDLKIKIVSISWGYFI